MCTRVKTIRISEKIYNFPTQEPTQDYRWADLESFWAAEATASFGASSLGRFKAFSNSIKFFPGSHHRCWGSMDGRAPFSSPLDDEGGEVCWICLQGNGVSSEPFFLARGTTSSSRVFSEGPPPGSTLKRLTA